MKRCNILLFTLLLSVASPAQQDNRLTLTGSIQSDILIPQTDEAIGASKTDDILTNTYVDLQLQHSLFEAGARLEYLEHPLPGFENDFKGWGVPHFYVKGRLPQKDPSRPSLAELTVGTFYEQFGSGFILRTYEERALGIDNSLLGARLVLKPIRGVAVKVLGGRQRHYWEWNHGYVAGADAEVSLDDLLPALQQHDTRLTLGVSWVNRYQKESYITRDVEEPTPTGYAITTYSVAQPEHVNAWEVRANLNHGPWSLLAEYARKTDDPAQANGYIFHKGDVAMLSASYSRRGLSLLLQAKRSENMSFKSDRTVMGISSAINHLPAFTQDHTYALAALYPYATQLADGEWAYQAELGYNFRRLTPLGGKYGMNVKVNYSYVRAINRHFNGSSALGPSAAQSLLRLAGTEGYTSSFFKWGPQSYYQDLDVQLSRKLTRDFKLTLMYMNQLYNKTIVEGEGGIIRSNIFVADAKWQLSPKTTLRMEAQYLNTDDDEGDWLFGLAELSLVPHWMLSVSDMYNSGHSDPAYYSSDTHNHYYQALVTYSNGAHRLQAGFGRTRAGYNCSGGVCRWIPAQKGLTLSYNYNF